MRDAEGRIRAGGGGDLLLTFATVAAVGLAVFTAAGGNVPSPARLLTRGPQDTPPLTVPATHVVRRGETLSHIARDYGIDPLQLASLNHVWRPSELDVGRRLLIPEAGSREQLRGADVLRRRVQHELAKVDESLLAAESSLRGADFEGAQERAETALQKLVAAHADAAEAGSRRARIEVVFAIAHTAFGKPEAARQSFVRALQADPHLVLDPAHTSPKVFGSFCAALKESAGGGALGTTSRAADCGDYDRLALFAPSPAPRAAPSGPEPTGPPAADEPHPVPRRVPRQPAAEVPSGPGLVVAGPAAPVSAEPQPQLRAPLPPPGSSPEWRFSESTAADRPLSLSKREVPEWDEGGDPPAEP